mmetsp:Transcript_4055/g.6718  ORF Transcript_4055/g.6718 Transcript_4055/m.6718 type:complete len:196 (-) Transcript_4055:47-634(-)
MTNLPQGWADRHNKMSEHDMKLGGMAATKFAKNSYSDINNPTTSASSGSYNNSDQVRKFYLNESQKQNGDESTSSKMGKNNGSVPEFWESRQKEKELQAKQMGVFAKNSEQSSKQRQFAGTAQSTNGKEAVYIDGHDDDDDAPEPEVALVQIATHALDAVAKSLSTRKVLIPIEDRASFANAMKQAMDALAKQSS